ATERVSAGTGPGKKLLLLSLVGLLVLGGAGGAAWVFFEGNDEKVHERENNPDGTSDVPGPIMELEPFLLNLADRDDLRFLKVSIKMELDRPEEHTDFLQKVPAIRDALLVLLSSKESQLLRTVNG